MFKFLKKLFSPTISPEVQSLVDAINNDEVVTTKHRDAGMACDEVVYNGVYNAVVVYAYKDSCYGYVVNLDGKFNCLPQPESRVVYKALRDYTIRRRVLEQLRYEEERKVFVESKLGKPKLDKPKP